MNAELKEDETEKQQITQLLLRLLLAYAGPEALPVPAAAVHSKWPQGSLLLPLMSTADTRTAAAATAAADDDTSSFPCLEGRAAAAVSPTAAVGAAAGSCRGTP